MSVFSWLPGLQAVRSYQRRWLVKDVVAGVVLTTLLVPQGMAYAELAGLPPITGLYTSILCLAGYAVFGPSRILVLGPDSSLGPMIAATILPLMAAGGDPARAVALASLLAIMVAAIMIVAAVARLGFIADLISKPTMIGYMNGLALTILIGQLPKLFGFKVSADGLIGEVTGFARGLAHGEANAAAAAVGIAGIALILVLQRWLPKVPAVLHLPGLVIYRFDAPLFFANAKTFRNEVTRLARADPAPAWILIAAEPVTDVDTTASDVLQDLDEMLNAQGISLVFAELKNPVRRKIERYGLTRTINPDHFYPTIEAAITAFRHHTNAQWTTTDQTASPPRDTPNHSAGLGGGNA